MSYSSGTITDAAPATALMTAWNTAIDGHAAWEFVEEVTSGNVVSRIYKCLGTVNSLGVDFYVAMTRSSATGLVGFSVGEGWNATTKKVTSGAPFLVTASTTPGTGGVYSTDRSPVTENSITAATAGYLHAAATITNTTGFDYRIAVTADCIVASCSVGGATQGPLYAGLYDSFHATSIDVMPVFVWGYRTGGAALTTDGFGNGAGARTRALGWTSGAGTHLWEAVTATKPWTWTVPVDVASSVSKETASGKWWASRVVVRDGWTSGTTLRGVTAGMLKPICLWLRLDEAAEAVGDTVTIDGTVYTCVHTAVATTTGSMWLSQGA